MFKVGSRVLHKYYGGGVIRAVDDSAMPYFVEFDKAHEELHSGWDGIYGKDKSCYWLDRDQLTLAVRAFKGNKHATAS